MGIELEIIDELGNSIDKYGIKWLYLNEDDYSHILHALTIKVIDVIKICDEQINELTNKINKLQIIMNCWNESDFEKRKKLKINLISSIDDESEFYNTLRYFAEYHTNSHDDTTRLIDGSKLIADIDFYSSQLSRFEYFKNFLTKYEKYKCKITN